jgi:sec-independent protein translocase protein TatA
MGPREIIIIAVIVVLLFGAPKLPVLARSIGKSLRILKDETKSLTSDESEADVSAREGQKPSSSSTDDETRGK